MGPKKILPEFDDNGAPIFPERKISPRALQFSYDEIPDHPGGCFL